MPDQLIQYFLTLSLVSQQVTENVLGTLLQGPAMRLAALAVTVGLAFSAQALGLAGLEAYSPAKIIVLGVAAGLGSNVVHALVNQYAPGAKKATLLGFLAPTKPTPK